MVNRRNFLGLMAAMAAARPLLAVTNYNMTFDGDSLTAGLGLSAPNAWPAQFLSSVTTLSVTSHANVAVSGQNVNDMIARAAANVDNTLVSSPVANILCALGGHNNLGGGDSAATTYGLIQSYFQGRSASWVKVAYTVGASAYLLTPGCPGGCSGTAEPGRTTLNSTIRAGYRSYADILVDYAADARFQNTADTTYYQSDGIHYTAAGCLALAQLTWAAIQAWMAGRGSSVRGPIVFSSGASVR
jgi:lysophospholipase L1-like esterase